MHSNCIVERRKTVEHNTIEMYSGAVTKRGETVEIEACGTSLFGSEEKKRGVCTSCLQGWDVEENSPTARGRDQIQRVKQ
jgi:hypothetical protein